MKIDELFRRRKEPKRFFALVISDQPTEGFVFTPDKDGKMFMLTGDVIPRDVIPRSVLRSAVDKFEALKPLEGEVKISEKRV